MSKMSIKRVVTWLLHKMMKPSRYLLIFLLCYVTFTIFILFTNFWTKTAYKKYGVPFPENNNPLKDKINTHDMVPDALMKDNMESIEIIPVDDPSIRDRSVSPGAIPISQKNKPYIKDKLTSHESEVNQLVESLQLLRYNMSQCAPDVLRSLSADVHSIGAPVTDQWQVVSEGHIFVYSAFLDERHADADSIKITALLKPFDKSRIFCQVWFDKGPPVIVEGKPVMFPEQGAARGAFMAVKIICRLHKFPADMIRPSLVSVVVDPCEYSDNLLNLHRNRPANKADIHYQYNYTVCLGGPLKFGLKNVNQLTEWIEMNAYFGADHFILYNHSASSELKPYIDYYVRERKLVKWMPWQLPHTIKEPRKMKNFGHLAMVYDCLYRSMYKSRNVVYMDTDEFLVPRAPGVHSWDALVTYANCEQPTSYISIQNVFFKKEWPDDEVLKDNEEIHNLELQTQLKTKKERKLWNHGERSKYIAWPELIDTPGIHKVHHVIRGTMCAIGEHDALIQHYRDWEDPRPNWSVDQNMHRYQKILLERVKQVHKTVENRFT